MIRFAVWAAVSTIEQADGVSLAVQVQKCRERGIQEGWRDTGYTFVADGYSRTGYSDLSKAEEKIPALREALGAMRADQYDVLTCYNYDRFGDLILAVGTEFRNYKKQLYSYNQPGRVVENYDPYRDDSSFLLQLLAPIWQKQRIADLRRKLQDGLPKRVEQGLTPLSIPFGYRWRGKKDAPDHVPAQLELVRQMRDWLMEGKSFMEIKRLSDQTGVLSPRGKPWDTTTIHNILANPYYAGMVALYKTQSVFDPSRMNRKRQVWQPENKWLMRPGKHHAIFTFEEYKHTARELDRRRLLNVRVSYRYPLSGLMFCSVCNRKAYRHNHRNARRGGAVPILTCNRRGPAHIIWEYDEAMPIISRAIQKAASTERPTFSTEQAINLEASLRDIEERRDRVQQSAELGVFTPAEAAHRIAQLEIQAERLHARMEEQQYRQATREQFFEEMGDILNDPSAWVEWIQNDEPATVNRLVSSLVSKIVLFPDKRAVAELR